MAREYGMGSAAAQEAEEIRAVENAEFAKKQKLMTIIVCGVMLLIGGLVLLVGIQNHNKLDGRLAAIDTEIETAMAEYNDTKIAYEANDGKTIVHVDPEMSSAAIPGAAVCDSQNRLIKLHQQYMEARKSDPYISMTDEHIAEIAEYNNWVTGKNTGMSAQEPWTTKGYWFFGNTYEYRGTGTHRVVWVCHSQNTTHSPIYAVTTGLYNPLTATFSDIHVYRLSLYTDDTAVTGVDVIDPGAGIAPATADQSGDISANPPEFASGQTEEPADDFEYETEQAAESEDGGAEE